MEQQSSDWLVWRQSGLGSSDASVIMGIDPYRDREQLLDDKLGRGEPMKKNFAMELGNKFEGAARALSYFDLDIEFEPITLTHPDLNWMRASLDGYSTEHNCLAEIKYMGNVNWEACRNANAPLLHHAAQMQHQLAVAGMPMAWYIPYTLTKDKKEINDICYIKVERNDVYIDNLIRLEKEFWDEVIKSKGL